MGRRSPVVLGPSFALAPIPTHRPRPTLTTSVTSPINGMPTPVHTSSSLQTAIGAISIPTHLTWTTLDSLAKGKGDTPLTLSLRFHGKEVSPHCFEAGKAKRAPSTSPLPSPNPRATRGSRSSPNGRVSPRASETWPTEHATTPISTYLRRKSPQMSPTSATFPRSAFDEPMAPVAIPALPALLSSFVFPQHRVSEPSSPTDISEPQVLVASD